MGNFSKPPADSCASRRPQQGPTGPNWAPIGRRRDRPAGSFERDQGWVGVVGVAGVLRAGRRPAFRSRQRRHALLNLVPVPVPVCHYFLVTSRDCCCHAKSYTLVVSCKVPSPSRRRCLPAVARVPASPSACRRAFLSRPIWTEHSTRPREHPSNPVRRRCTPSLRPPIHQQRYRAAFDRRIYGVWHRADPVQRLSVA